MVLRGQTEDLPARLGRYQLVRRFPSGTMTDVYLARIAGATSPERLLVIKALSETSRRDGVAEARFLEEAVISLSLAHGNVITTFETGRAEDGTPFLVMEYVHGASLRELLSKGPLSPPLAVFVAREVARALRYTHTFVDFRGRNSPIIHLDVTPENVLISRAGNVKLTDFGIARAVGQLDSGAVFGKAAYVAPEILASREGGLAADLWSLGCVLFEMLTGEAPHRGRDMEETLAFVRAGRKPPSVSLDESFPPGVAEELDALLQHMLEPDPDLRISDAASVERALAGMMMQAKPFPNEADLEALMARRFPIAEEHGHRHRLRAELEASGRSVSGAESTSELLSEGTVPLSIPSNAGVADETSRPRTGSLRRPRKMKLTFLLLTLGALTALFLWRAPLDFSSGGDSSAAATGASSESPDSGAALGVGLEDQLVTTAPSSGPHAPVAGEAAQSGTTPSEAAVMSEDEPRPTRADIAARPAPASLQLPSRPSTGGGRLHPAAAASVGETALLQINAYPYARVTLNGELDLGTTPLRDVSVPAGTHVLRFTNPELGLERELKIEVAADEERVVGVRLDR